MEIYNELSNQKLQKFRLPLSINFTVIGIFFFTLYFSITKSFIPYEISLTLLFFSIITLLFGRIISREGFLLTKVDLMWILYYILLVSNITLNNLITPQNVVDILVYTSAIIFLISVKVNIDYYKSSLKLITFLGLVYALSSIFQYLYTDLYLNNVLPLFSQNDQSNILSLLRSNSYTGITNQTAYIAGYTVSAIGIIVFTSWKSRHFSTFLKIFVLIILFVGLLLSSKRAHLIFMIMAILLTTLFSINNREFIKYVLRLVMVTIAIIMLLIILYNSIDFKEDSPIISFINELEYTFVGFIEGEDVSSGRTVLYSYSWELFNQSPITGIGWKEFRENSIGLINSDRGSHPHNIYLQLLTELGILGFILFIIPLTYIYYKTFQLLRALSFKNNSFHNWKTGIQFSFFTQTFFILYGLTGNLLTDFNFLLLYFFVCSISISGLVKIQFNKR